MGLLSTVKHATIYGATLLLGAMFAIGPFMELVQRCCRRKNPATMPKERTCEEEFRSLSWNVCCQVSMDDRPMGSPALCSTWNVGTQ